MRRAARAAVVGLGLGVIVVIAVFGTLAPGPARANPVDLYGFGARGPAMGGAQTAATRDGGATYHNPAALADLDDVQLDVGYQLARPHLELNGGDQGVDASRGLAAALSAPGELAGVRLAFGLGVFLPDERVTRVRTLPAGRPRWALYDNRPQRLFLGAALAVRLGDRVLVGAGLTYLSRTRGSLELTGRVGYPIPEDSELALDVDVALVTVRTPQAGILVHARPWLDVGLAYRGGFVLELDQVFAIRGDLGPRGAPPILDDALLALRSRALDLFQPEQVAAGFAARLTPHLLVAGDLTLQRWSRFVSPAARVTIDHDLKQFDDRVVIPAAPPLPAPSFSDVVVPRVGVEWIARAAPTATWAVRAGYAWEPSPAPEQQDETNLVDNDKHTLSAGLGVSLARVTEVLPRPFDLDVYVAATLLPTRTHRKLSPVDPVGDYASRGLVLAGGVGSSWRF